MARFGNGYGSECHLLRWMGRHRNDFDREVLKALGAQDGRIEWLDFDFIEGHGWADAEWKGLDFLSQDVTLQSKWQAFWPTGRGVQNWDVVGQLLFPDGSRDWVLVEAKAHVQEIQSDCQARAAGSRDQITAALTATKTALGVAPDRDWTAGYYQFTNRLATLYFLESHGIHARLLFIYFLGDHRPDEGICPASIADWTGALAAQAAHVGLPEKHALSDRIHKLFLRVDGMPAA